jgi:hypothetical protein
MLHDHRGHFIEAFLGAAKELLVHREACRAGEAGDGCPDDRPADAEVGRQHRGRYGGEDARDELDGTQLDSWSSAHHPPLASSVIPSASTFARPGKGDRANRSSRHGSAYLSWFVTRNRAMADGRGAARGIPRLRCD